MPPYCFSGPKFNGAPSLPILGSAPLARSETRRMITEKVQALGEAQTAASFAAISGRNRRHVAKKVLGVYKKRVRKNRRRLAK